MSKRFPGQSKCAMPSIKSKPIYIGLGSNLGDGREQFNEARKRLEGNFGVPLVASSVYRSEPVDFLDQPWFMNQVIILQLDNSWRPTAVLRVLKEIETAMGREKTIRYGPRLIDLDLLLYDDWVFENGELTIPHPKIEERAFVLMPLVELVPGLVSPRTGRCYADILKTKGAELSACVRIE